MAKRRGTRQQRPSTLYEGRYMSNNNYYNASSVAYDYAVPEYNDYPNESQYEQQVIIRRRRKRRVKPKYIKAKNMKKSISLTTYLTIGLFFVCAFICVTSISKNWNQQRINVMLIDELKVLRGRTSELIVEVSQSMDLAEIENIARRRLQMSEPQAHQIVEISVPRQNYTVYNQIDDIESLTMAAADSRTFSLSGIKNILFKD